MLLTAARWAHLSCSTYPLLLTPLTTGSWRSPSALRYSGRCAGLVCLLLRRQNPGGHRRPRHITGILAIDRGPTGFGVGAKVICHLRRGCARNFRIPAGDVPPVRR